MKPYIFGARNGIYIVDLQKTVRMFKTAYDFVTDTVESGQSVLFVGTKKQALGEAIYEEANRCEMFMCKIGGSAACLPIFRPSRRASSSLIF